MNQKRVFQEVTKDVSDFLAFIRVNTIKIQEGGNSEGNRVFKRIEAGDSAVAERVIVRTVEDAVEG